MNHFPNVAIITAKGNSSRVPRKNYRRLNGTPLFIYTLDAALQSEAIDLVVLTTDHDIIKTYGVQYANQLGMNNRLIVIDRPKELTLSDVQVEEVSLHALRVLQVNHISSDRLIFLQPTSPFRDSAHITDAISLFPGQGSLFAAYKSNGFYWQRETGGMAEITRPIGHDPARRLATQEQYLQKSIWRENGAIYICNTADFSKFKSCRFAPFTLFPMSARDSIDIDYEEDWIQAEVTLDEYSSRVAKSVYHTLGMGEADYVDPLHISDTR